MAGPEGDAAALPYTPRMYAPRSLGESELIGLSALSTSIVAMATDTMLPALDDIARALHAADANQRQLVIALFFGGLALGQLFYGPLADSYGRRPIFALGILLFIGGTALSASATTFTQLLVGRALAGFGAAAPRVLTLAILRDLYAGEAMARVMSFISAVFIVVPALAPSLGQQVLRHAGWRAIFIALAIGATINLGWFLLRQPETLPRDKRTPLRQTATGCRTAVRDRTFVLSTLAAGLCLGAFITYLSTAAQVFEDLYQERARFPVLFAGLALALGAASLANARWLRRTSIAVLTRRALKVELALALGGLALSATHRGKPPLPLYLLLMAALFFTHGPLYGNLSARAMASVGRTAGLGAALNGSVATLLGVCFARAFGSQYAGSVGIVSGAFACAAALSLALVAAIDDHGHGRSEHALPARPGPAGG
jgi:DHA1 family bicyclomycin/chloramphenicol resistance-like MFS transporter